MKHEKNHNGGFSLVELLIGVLILGIVVSPLLHTMITGMNTAAKGRRTQNVTMLAQTLTETVNAASLDALLTDPYDAFLSLAPESVHFYDAAFGETQAPDRTVFSVGLKGLRTADGTADYDAMITFNASGYAPNDESVSIYTAMDSIFTQPAGAGENPDVAAASQFADTAFDAVYDAATDPEHEGRSYDAAPDAEDFFFRKNGATMDRTVTIVQEERTEADGGDTANITGYVVFSYTASCTVGYTSESGDGHLTVTDSYKSEALEFTVGDDQGSAAPKALYFFFYPNYGGDDTLDLVRCDTRALRAFLVRQSPPLYFSPDTDTNNAAWQNRVAEGNATYLPTVQLREPFSSAAALNPVADLYLNFTPSSGTGRYRFVTIHDLRIDAEGDITGISVFRGVKNAHDGLVVQAAQDRLYAVTVGVYTAGESFAADARILRLESTIVK